MADEKVPPAPLPKPPQQQGDPGSPPQPQQGGSSGVQPPNSQPIFKDWAAI